MTARTDAALRLAAPFITTQGRTDWSALSGSVLRDALVREVRDPDESVAYLVLAVLQHRIPLARDIVEFTRAWRTNGLAAPLATAVRHAVVPRSAGRLLIARGTVVDVTDTSRSRFTTGIQRVARETVSRWRRDHDVMLAAWDVTGTKLMTVDAEEHARTVLPAVVAESEPAVPPGVVVIPFGGTLVLPEIAVMIERADSLRTIAQYAGVRSVAVGFDCIPITTAETSGGGMPGAFSRYLSTLARFDAVAAISDAAAVEYGGWAGMLPGSGITPPSVRTVALPAQVDPVPVATVARVAAELGLGDVPVVLSVGSHEPRKNHMNLLVAAERNWRAGHDFALVLVGGNAWGAEEFTAMVDDLRRIGRRVVTLSGVDDDVVWSLYRMARFSTFCSLNEGFGLPVVESLATNTPVITSDFGSMRELGAGHGAVLVGPTDIDAMTAAMATLLTDDALLERLVDESRSFRSPNWDDYAVAMWDVVAPAGASR